MDSKRPSTPSTRSASSGARRAETRSTESQAALLAKAALKRLVSEKLEPTPDNYARAYELESGGTPQPLLPERAQKALERVALRAFDGSSLAAHEFVRALSGAQWDAVERAADRPDGAGKAWAELIDKLIHGVGRGGRQWTTARKKQSLQRVLDGSRSDAHKLQTRLQQLAQSWDSDTLDETVDVEDTPTTRPSSGPALADASATESAPRPPSGPDAMGSAATVVPPTEGAADSSGWGQSVQCLHETVQIALPAGEPNAAAVSRALRAVSQKVLDQQAPAARVQELSALCADANRVINHRHHLMEQLGQLCHELTASLSDLAEEDSWVKGQCAAMNQTLSDGLTARGVKSVGEVLRNARQRQTQLRAERTQAREALKGLIHRMIEELGVLGQQTGRFHDSVGRYAEVIESADSLESLATVVREMVEESQAVQVLVAQARDRIQSEHSKAQGLSERVQELERELVRLSDEVSTDQLTRIANRRGLIRDFEKEVSAMARAQIDGGKEPLSESLCVGLLDIDNFKRLNDELGHSAGDEALRSLAEVVSKSLRPSDRVARYGGEEFVVLLPRTPLIEGQQILTRLQRSLSGGLFMHEQKQVFVTFSAGVTHYRMGERLEDALERADQALYEAKRSGKNRTCTA
jgi:diguanylate cyclase